MYDLIVDRIKTVQEEKGLSSSAFADAIDIQRSSVSHIMSGRNKPSLDVIQKILYKFPDINPAWLLTGKGNMKQLDLFEGIPPETKKAVLTRVMERDKQEEPVKIPEVRSEFQQPFVEQKPIPPPVIEVQVTPSIAKETIKPMAAAKAEEPIQHSKNILPNTDKQIEKILVFYTDKTFSVYKPE